MVYLPTYVLSFCSFTYSSYLTLQWAALDLESKMKTKNQKKLKRSYVNTNFGLMIDPVQTWLYPFPVMTNVK